MYLSIQGERDGGKETKKKKVKKKKNKNHTVIASRGNIVVITCLTQTILRSREVGIPAKISAGITK